jgi:hypothetical protein
MRKRTNPEDEAPARSASFNLVLGHTRGASTSWITTPRDGRPRLRLGRCPAHDAGGGGDGLRRGRRAVAPI